MTQQVKAFAAKFNNLSSIPRSCTTEGKNQFYKTVCDFHVHAVTCRTTHTTHIYDIHTYTLNQ